MNRTRRDRVWSQFYPTEEPPRSALNLRLGLAIFGLLLTGTLAVLMALKGAIVLTVVLGVLALIALIDMIVVIRRRAARGGHHSLFE